MVDETDDEWISEFKVSGVEEEWVLLPRDPSGYLGEFYFGDDVPVTRRNLAWVSCRDDTEGSPFFYATLDEINDDLVAVAHNLQEYPEFTIERRGTRTDRQLVEHFRTFLRWENASLPLRFALEHGGSFDGLASDVEASLSDTCEVEVSVTCWQPEWVS